MRTKSPPSSSWLFLKVLIVFLVALSLQGMTLVIFDESGTTPRTPVPNRSQGPASAIISTFNVVNTGDSVEDPKEGSLRYAIQQANAHPGRDAIRFSFFEPSVVTITLVADLDPITEAVDIDGGGTVTPTVSIDGQNVRRDLMVISGTIGTTLRGLRLVNASSGACVGASVVTDTIIANTVCEGSLGGFRLQHAHVITYTHNVISGIDSYGTTVTNSSKVWLQQNTVQDVFQGNGIDIGDGVIGSVVISNTLSGLSSGVMASGDPAPVDVLIRGNVYSDTVTPIVLGPGANRDFPAPQIQRPILISGTRTLRFEAVSKASPRTYSYPLSLDLYRVRDGNFIPFTETVLYEASDFPNARVISLPYGIEVIDTDQVAAIATTANPSTSQFSDPEPIVTLPLDVAIDIKPGSDPNPVNCRAGRSVVPVAILSTPDFDATTVDHTTVRFGKTGTEAAETHVKKKSGQAKRHEEDVDGDGDTDLVFHFRVGDAELACGDEEAVLTGETFDGLPFTGSDAIRTVGNAAHKSAAAEAKATPDDYALFQNYPNPFNPATTIRFHLPEASHVVLRVFNLLGQEIRVLADGPYEAGTHRIRWDSRANDGRPVPSGVYLYRLQAGDYSAEETMLLLR